MSYEKKSIKQALELITSGQMYLPAIQRKYVWSENQIVRLMDSIMRGYPIGTFLFWDISGQTINEKKYSLYEFIRDYHERDRHNNPHAPNPITKERIIAVLDGQQRLTSLYLALQGSLAKKVPMKRWASPDSFPTKELYINLKFQPISDEDEMAYEFKFLTELEAASTNGTKAWYKIKNILQYQSTTDVILKEVEPKGWIKDKMIMDNLSILHERLTKDESINYFAVKNTESIDEVLDIFVRVNSGGAVLSKSDLLFSTIVSHWDKARDEMEELLIRMNDIGDKFKFTNDFILRSCLYVLNMPINLKVEAFKKESIDEIRKNWSKIKTAIIDTVSLLNEFGFNSENVISYVAITPIVYYRFHAGKIDSNSKNELRKYFVVAQVKQIFGASSNSTLAQIREALRKQNSGFQLASISNIRFTGDRNLRFSTEEVDSLFELEKGAYSFMILSLLYPNLKYAQNGFHQDHLHPFAGFNDSKLKDLGLSEMDKNEWQQKRNKLPNLQLLEGKDNISKNDKPLIEWLKSESNKNAAKFLPTGVSFELKDFENFYNERQKLMSQELKQILT